MNETEHWKQDHAEYLKSDHWQDLRLRALARAGSQCEACKCSNDLQGHHTRYEQDFRKCTIDDVMCLCRDCHDIFHRYLKTNNRPLSQFSRQGTIETLAWINKQFFSAPKVITIKKQPPPFALNNALTFELRGFLAFIQAGGRFKKKSKRVGYLFKLAKEKGYGDITLRA